MKQTKPAQQQEFTPQRHSKVDVYVESLDYRENDISTKKRKKVEDGLDTVAEIAEQEVAQADAQTMAGQKKEIECTTLHRQETTPN